MNKRNRIILQISMNIIPLIGVIFYNWSVFALIYSYWLESLGIVFFRSIMILTAQNSPEKSPHFKKALKYLTFNTGILFFYLLFIIGFIGFVVSDKQEGASFLRYLVFIDDGFRYTIISLVTIRLLEIINFYFIGGIYKTSSPDDFYKFFDVRFIMIHIVIVLGFFAFNFLSKNLNSMYGIIAFAAIFVIVKSVTDVVSIYLSKTEKKNIGDISSLT